MASSSDYKLAIKIAGSVDSSLEQTTSKVSSLFSSMVSADLVASAIKSISSAIADFASDAVETYTTFEQSMANTAAIAGATGDEYDALYDAARAAGSATTFTAAESADALGYMALAGWDVETSISALTPVLQLAEATGADLATTSDQVTDSMSALGLSVDELEGYLDTVVAANNNANTTASDLMEAIIGCAGAASNAQLDYTELSTALGVLANNGIKGSEAGTALNSMLTRMTSKDTALAAYESLGVAIYDASGNMRDFQDILIDTNAALDGLSDSEKNSYLADIAGTNYISDFTYLLDSVAESADGTASAWDTLSDALENSEGALETMDAQVTDTVSGAMARMESALDDAKIGFIEAFGPTIADVLDTISSEVMPNVTAALETAGAFLSDKLAPIIQDVFGWLQDNALPIVESVFGWFEDTALPIVQNVFGWIQDNVLPIIEDLVSDKLSRLQTTFGTVCDFITSTLFPVFQDIVESILPPVMDAFDAISNVIQNTVVPILTDLGEQVIPIVSSALELVGSFISDTMAPIIQDVADNVIPKISTALQAVADFMSTYIMPAFQDFVDNAWPIMEQLGNDISAVWEDISAVLQGVLDFITDVFQGDWGAAWEDIVGVFASAWDGLKGIVATAWNAVVGVINTGINSLNSISITLPEILGGGTLGFNIPNIPTIALAAGGIVDEPTSAMIGEGGEPEAVMPLSKLGSLLDGVGLGSSSTSESVTYSPTITINGSASQSDVAAALDDAFEEFKSYMAQYEHERRRTAFARI